ncbi:WecB/TagA/CpsF family glycosyltransferase [Carnobacterium maltaromaticum]|uniref:WecB/TagA/CpsF family glycosyltransferase n=1 Tax=Carnobacterium maltaromaticum TaxID=2751 RepID=A0AAW9JUM1_CARML|nr:WecB/TagA/CpsF family glycosyltransferase [Carnobacterium maltaromaticum]MDZ5759258.1 WecB/TagA/CpsF family glycosyltransferase [Carnobacterium maltaromaticum]
MRIKLLNSYVDNLTMEESLDKVEKIIAEKLPTQHVVINANKINLMEKDPILRKIVNSSPLINADGASILLAGKLLKQNIVQRVTGIDLYLELLKKCEKSGYRPYFFGADSATLDRMLEVIQKNYPDIVIAGARNGFFREEESNAIVEDIKKSQADILFVAFPSPKKEYWIHENLNQLNVPFVMGVGGSFDVLAGKTKRAPKLMQNMGLEWFYRFVQEPGRMAKRYLVGNSIFLLHIVRERIRLENE